MTIDKIMEIVTTCVASVGGIGGVVAILCTMVKILGGNSVKARLAASKIDTDNTMHQGLNAIGDSIMSRMTADINVDISSKLDKAVERALSDTNEAMAVIEDKLIILSEGLATLLDVTSGFGAINESKQSILLKQSDRLKAIEPAKHDAKPIVHIALKDVNEASAIANESVVAEPTNHSKRRVI